MARFWPAHCASPIARLPDCLCTRPGGLGAAAPSVLYCDAVTKPEGNPWQTLSSDLKYSNPWIDLTEHQVITPGGSPGIYGTIHLHHLAIGIIALDGQGNTWLVGQWRYPLGLYSWEIPEGGGSLNLPPLESAKRELKEETGIEAASWQRILEMHLSNSVTDERCFVYLATGLSFDESTPDETEALTVRKLLFEDAYQMVLRGEITDAISVAAILRLKLILAEGPTMP